MSNLKVSKLSCIREILLLSILVYLSQGFVIPKGTVFTQISLLLIFIISIYYGYKVILLEAHRSLFIGAWSALLILCMVGYLITLDIGNPYYFSQIKAILLFLLPLFPFYYLAKNGKLTEKHLLRFFLLMFLVTILNFNYSEKLILLSRDNDSSDVVNNLAYQFVLLIPYLFMVKRNLVSILFFGIIFSFIIQGSKRGALIVGVLISLFFIYHRLSMIDHKYRVRSYILLTFCMGFLVFYLYKYFLSNEYLINRFSRIDDGGSGRDIIYSSLLGAWYNSDNILNFIFGYGFSSTLDLSSTGNFAHNDWLEILINFGLLGFFLYILIFLGLLKIVYKEKFKKEYKLVLLAIIFMWFLITLFSMVFNSYSSVIITLLIAFLIGRSKFEKKTNCI
ncbi:MULTISPECIES: O-antigen ligase [unclassified Acinetobacter]|uniref:O-antigen ligase family protein n=1 Tax=unclassified Acinetobacter TaxID=196816 RepID=UPI0015D208D5|nr:MULTISPECIES: hypothetical protein [unclassified Acinetobacter]